jgi:hypothetical protein
VSPTDTSNVYDFYEPDPVTVSPTDTSNVYDFYEPDPVTVYGGGSNDEETVMLQPVTYTGPAVETTLDTDPVVDFSLDDLTNIRRITPPQTNGLEIIRNLHTMLIKTIGMISTILLLMIQKLFQKLLERCQRKK